VRNLLHDQVTQPGAPALTARWNDLIEREEEFRHAHGRMPSPRPLTTALAFG